MRRKPSCEATVLAVLLFASLFLWPCFSATAVVNENLPVPEQPSAAAPEAPADPSSGKGSEWRSFLWEAIPTEWLQSNKNSYVLEAYQLNQWKPFFITSRFELTPRAQALLAKLEKLEDDAMDPRPFRLDALHKRVSDFDKARVALMAVDPNCEDSRANLADGAQAGSPSSSPTDSRPVQYAMDSSQVQQAGNGAAGYERDQKYQDAFRKASELDIRLTQAFCRLAQEMNPFADQIQVKALVQQTPVEQLLQELAPTSPHYTPLCQALVRYRQLTAHGGQIMFNEKIPLRSGESGPHVAKLQKRLQQEGFYSGAITGSFDSHTQQAVQSFQRAHLIQPDGTVGQTTKDWLNVPYAKKLQMITESVRSVRQSQTRPCDRFVRINIPQFQLEYCKEGKVQEVHRVIVGKASGKKIKFQGRMIGENHTPTLTSQIEHVIFNPRWYITDRIIRELSDEIRNPAFLAKHGYVRMDSLYPSGDHRMFQMPGPTNPLGRVKFEFVNAYAVFLHDTPKKHLFGRTRRDFSHGCVRVEGALQLAKTLLDDDQNPAAGKTERLIESSTQTYVKLQQPVPIVIEYTPVVSNGHGQLLFCGDPYSMVSVSGQS